MKQNMKSKEQYIPLVLVTLAAIIMTLPFLGLTEFTTKGEPREAVVAVSMINDGNWILPVNNGCDIPYKPPFMHWIIALFSLVAGHMSEYVSRLPSALALIAMTVGCYAFFAPRRGKHTALLAALLTLTSFEVHRAGVSCRVDMVLTACTVGSILLLYRWRESRCLWTAVGAVLCMSGAVMTKGPVGMVLPCLAMGIFSLLRGDRLWSTALRLTVVGLLACVLPALWYVSAYQQGGQHFLDLVIEENVGRMTGTMSYGSHEHAWPYNLLTLITGWLPWTLLLLISLTVLPWRKLTEAMGQTVRGREWRTWTTQMRQADATQVFTWVSLLTVFVFYCLPSSKRSVYLLPCYPFMAVLLAEYIVWLIKSRRDLPLRAFTVVMSVLAIILTVAFAAVRMGCIPQALGHGKHGADNMAMAEALARVDLCSWRLILIALLAVVAVYALLPAARRRMAADRRMLAAMPMALVVTLFLAVDGVYQPTVMNTKSLRPMAEVIEKRFPAEHLYSYVSADMMHFFGANYYIGNRIGDFETARPQQGVLLITDKDRADFFARHADYRFSPCGDAGQTKNEMKQTVFFYRFAHK